MICRTLRPGFVAAFSLALAACMTLGTSPSPASAARPSHDMVAAIRAAGDREQSVINVSALRDPGVTALQEAAQADERGGRYVEAAAKLDQALKLSPDSPDLLQQRAEIAVLRGDYDRAEKLAHQSWSLGPRLGPLCARNWQTVVEMRLQAGDPAAAERARHWVQECHKAGIPRY
jgi:tetratricopeptide (TPR) repeat protein